MKAQLVAFQGAVDATHTIPEGNSFKKRAKRILVSTALFTLFSLFNSTVFGQEYRYQFRLKNVTDLAEAKMVTDILRPVFNTEEAPFTVFPTFNDLTDQFDFVAETVISKEELEAVLITNGLELQNFSSIQVVKSQTEER